VEQEISVGLQLLMNHPFMASFRALAMQDFVHTSSPRLGLLGPDRLTGIIMSLAKV
jgi:hypothetical protein